jgi:hypothetical protein
VNVPTRLGAYALVLAGALGAGALVGDWAGPLDVGGADHQAAPPAEASALPAGGLLVAQDGYRLVTEQREVDSGAFAFTILGPDGGAVHDYDVVHERELHLIVASRDLTTFHHLHPARDADGRWTTELPDLPPGPYRAFADFQPTGADRLTLGIDLLRPGTAPSPSPLRPAAADEVGGFEVTLARPGGDEVAITVRRDGEPITPEPYLGAAGHLVALRDGDLAYVHVHPLDGDGSPGPVRFAVELPSAGTYALFFDFQVDGEVHTARFVVDAGDEVADPAGEGHTDEPSH